MKSTPAHFFLASWTLCQREMVRFYRQKSRIIGVIGSPLVFWFLIGSGLGGSFRHPEAQASSMNYLEYFFPGTIVLIILFTSIFSTISIIEDRREGFLQSVIVAPVSRGSIAFGKILGGTFLALIQAAILLALVPFLGISLSLASLLIVVFVLFLISFGLTGLGFIIAWKMDSTQGFHALMNLFLIPLWLLSGALFPPSGASRWLGTLMKLNPLTYGIDALRTSLYLSRTPPQDSSSLTTSIGVTVVFAFLMFMVSSSIVKRTEVG